MIHPTKKGLATAGQNGQPESVHGADEARSRPHPENALSDAAGGSGHRATAGTGALSTQTATQAPHVDEVVPTTDSPVERSKGATNGAHPVLDAAWKQHICEHTDTKQPTKCNLGAPQQLTESLSQSFKEERSSSWAKRQMERTAKLAEKIEPWTDIMVAIAQANPISGLVLGIFKATIETTVQIGSRISDIGGFEQSISRSLRLLAKCEERRIDGAIDEHVEAAYGIILSLLCSAHDFLAAQEESLAGATKWSGKFKDAANELETHMQAVDRLFAWNTAQIQDRDIEDRNRLACFEYLIQKGWAGGQLQLSGPSSTDGTEEAPDSCNWVSHDPGSASEALRNWHEFLKSGQTRTLVLTGPVGTGKTFVAASVARQLQHAFVQDVVATFYCVDDGVHNNAPAILRGLLHQLASQIPQVLALDQLVGGKDQAG